MNLDNANIYITSLSSSEGTLTRVVGDWGYENIANEGQSIAPWRRCYRVYVRADEDGLKRYLSKIGERLSGVRHATEKNAFLALPNEVLNVVRDVMVESMPYSPIHEFREGRWRFFSDREQKVRQELYLRKQKLRSMVVWILIGSIAALILWLLIK